METIEELEIPKVKKGGKPRTTDRLKADGSYDHKPTDPNYFRDYYRNKLSVKCLCDRCGRTICKARVNRHQDSDICKVIALTLSQNSIIVVV